MKQETFDTAQELQTRLEDIKSAIQRLEKNEKNSSGHYPTDFIFCYGDETDSLHAIMMKHFKARLFKIQKEFDSLK